jgi:hypothetical protein
MKAKDWKFDKYLPDAEDVEAQYKALDAFFSLLHPVISKQSQAERELSIFCAGFNRGIAWNIAKTRKEEE